MRDEAGRFGIVPAEVVERNETYRQIEASVAGRDQLALHDPRSDQSLSREDYERWSV